MRMIRLRGIASIYQLDTCIICVDLFICFLSENAAASSYEWTTSGHEDVSSWRELAVKKDLCSGKLDGRKLGNCE